MLNFRLRVFYAVATHLSFTKAAEDVLISQPAITKNIKELEVELNTRLFDRVGGRVSLTEAGHILLLHTQKILELDRQLTYELSSLKEQFSGKLSVGASTTIGQYVLPSILAKFHDKYPLIEVSLINGNTQQIEDSLQSQLIEIGVVEGKSRDSLFKYIPFIRDEIVSIVHTSQPLSQETEITLEELKTIPIVLREQGSGSLDIINEKLKIHGVSMHDLNVIMHLGSTESIKSYQEKANCLSFISIHAVSKGLANGDFKIIDIKDFEINRTFNFVHLHGHLSGLSELFVRFAQKAITGGYEV